MATQNPEASLNQRRRSQILDAAAQVFAQQGFHQTTIRQVAKAAGIADGTIYLYFASKHELLLGILERLNDREQREIDFNQALDSRPSGFIASYFEERVGRLMDQMTDLQAALPAVLSDVSLRERYFREIFGPTFELANPVVQLWIDQGILRPAQAELLTRSLSSSILGLVILRMLGDEVATNQWPELARTTINLVLYGILQEPPHE